MARRIALLALVVVATAIAPAWASALPAAPNCPVLPADNVWHADISGLPVHTRSAAWLASANAGGTRLHPDFGSSGDPSAPYGIPWVAVPDSHAMVTPTFDYADESDPGPYPFGPETPIEGGPNSGDDRHALMVDKDTSGLHATRRARPATPTSRRWERASGCGPTSTSPGTGPTPKSSCAPCSTTA